MSAATDVSLANLDLFEAQIPWQTFDELRANNPVHWSEEPAPNSGGLIFPSIKAPDSFIFCTTKSSSSGIKSE